MEDDAWQSGGGTLSYTLTGLPDSTQYDVQVRAVNANGAGAWSATATGTPDHGNTATAATALTLGTDIPGMIDSGTDVDYLTFTLTQGTGIIIWTTGDLDTVGELQDSSGTVVASRDDHSFSDPQANFRLWKTLSPGTYTLKVSSYGGATGSYVLHTRAMVDTSSEATAQEITLDSDGNGTALGLIDPGGLFDRDYFTFTLAATTEVVIRTSGVMNRTHGTLFDSAGNTIARSGDEHLYVAPTQFLRPFVLRARLAAGTYTVEVTGAFINDPGWYTLHIEAVTEPGDTRATATTLDLSSGRAGGGTINPATDVDYFRLVVAEDAPLVVGAMSTTVNIDGALLDSEGNTVDAKLYEFDSADDQMYDVHDHDDEWWGFYLRDTLAAGTYYIKVTPNADDTTDAATGRYTLRAFADDAYTDFVEDCADIPTAATINDPLYGCQWHLHNTGQVKGAGEDINVEDVWAAGTLGAGINVAVVDDGFDYAHEDLSANVDTTKNHDYTGGGDIFHPFRNHGTLVAGLIAARDNDKGIRGVAPRATIYGYNLLGNMTDANKADAMTRNLATTAVVNNSWGSPDTTKPNVASSLWRTAIDTGITTGFGGKGISYVFGVGLKALVGGYANLGAYVNHRGVIPVCSVDIHDKRSIISEPGANLWVCAPANKSYRYVRGLTTTSPDDFYLKSFGGTSAATPIVSGVVALMRSVNPTLTWRDVKFILAESARKNDPDNPGWEDGALKYGSDTERYHYNHEYGFGVVDAKAAVDLAAGWPTLPALLAETRQFAPVDSYGQPLLQGISYATGTFDLAIGPITGSRVKFVEFVEVDIEFARLTNFRDLKVELISPSGKVSILSETSPSSFVGGTDVSVHLASAKHLGEDPFGTWRLRITSNTDAWMKSWSLTVHGHRYLITPLRPWGISLNIPGPNSLTVRWHPPVYSGPAPVTAYDVRYIKYSERESNNWTVIENVAVSYAPRTDGMQYTINGLEGGVQYITEARAVNPYGAGPWGPGSTGRALHEAPYFLEGDATTRGINENVDGGTNVGSPVVATDPTNETVTYALSGTDAGSFAINASTGQLSVASGTVLDHEAKARYTVIVTATDPGGYSDSITVTIIVVDSAFAPADAIVGVALTSTPKLDTDGDGVAETYGAGETIEVTVTWDADVVWDVSAPDAAIKLLLHAGGGPGGLRITGGGALCGRLEWAGRGGQVRDQCLYRRYPVARGGGRWPRQSADYVRAKMRLDYIRVFKPANGYRDMEPVYE